MNTPIKKSIHLFRLKSDYVLESGYKYNAGIIFAQWLSPQSKIMKTHKLATPTLPHFGYMNYVLSKCIQKELVEEISIEDIEKLKPHWHRQFKMAVEYYSENVI